MSRSSSGAGGSLILAEEYFNAEDARFVDAIRQVTSSKQLAGFVDRWRRDPRPWARRQIFAYLAQPLDSMGHNVVVKRLFKHAEAAGDDELMAAFLVVFDCLVRRERKRRWHYDWQTGEAWDEEVLATPRNTLPSEPTTTRRDPWTGRQVKIPSRIPLKPRLFSHRTRYYLRRRAWRYFRRMGYQRPEAYSGAIARALRAYQDDDLAQGEHILDSWGLVHVCFRGHDALEFGAAKIRLKEGRSLSELTPAPRFADLWRKPESMPVLLGLVTQARSRLVRVWAMQLVKREHEERLADMPPEEILALLDHEDEEIQQFAAALLRANRRLAKLPMETWFRLLEAKGTAALATICEVMQKHVAAERLELGDCIRLACAEPAPVARLGLELLKSRRIESAEDREAIAAVAGARCFATGGELAAWALGILGAPENYDRDVLLRFFDSLQEPVRRSTWEWLNREESPGYDDPVLWCRLLETPYDELRLRLVDVLERRASLPGTGSDALTPVWCAVLLGVHRGGRQKAKATRQIARALEEDPSRAETFLPVLAVAVRSVRAAEVRAGLAAVVRAVEARPELADQVKKHLPELTLEAEGVTG
jgi:hypothetical protein